MPGPAFHLEVLDRAVEALAAGSPDDKARAALLRDNAPWARLGALGPDILRHRPIPPQAVELLATTPDLAALDPAKRDELAKAVQPNPEMAAFALAFRVLVPRYAALRALDDLLAELLDILVAEDADRLVAFKPRVAEIQAQAAVLAGVSDDLARVKAAGGLAVALGRPAIQGEQAAAPARAWRPHEYLRWKRTGAFARALLQGAEAAADDRLRAFALGWLAHVAGAVVGEPFVNSIVQGPYRSHWWRNRFVRNHVDAFAFGRYRTPAAMNGDEPLPPYGAWRTLCGAELQDEVRVDPVAGPDAVAAVLSGAMPGTPGFDAVAGLVAGAVAQTYGAEPMPLRPPAALPDPAALREAYVGTLAVLWFMTGRHPTCPAPLGPPPPGAETPPPWFTDGTAPPPAPSTGGGGSSAGDAVASGILAAILFVIALLTGNLIVGAAAAAAALAAAINAAEAGDPVDWAGLRNHFFWLRTRVAQAGSSIHDGLLTGGLGYPNGDELGTLTQNGTLWVPALDQSGVALTRSGRLETYPLRMFGGVDGAGAPLPPDAAFLKKPGSGVEAPATVAAFEVGQYVDRIVDGIGLRNGGLLGDDGTPFTRDRDMGDAASNAVELIRAGGEGLADYNLDGDRGYGWKCWRPKAGTTLADPGLPVSVVEE